MTESFPKIAQLRNVAGLRARLAELELELPVDDTILTSAQGSPLAEPIQLGPLTAGNRWCIHPMEGWDANRDGSPTEYTLRRWSNFGRSGAKLIWGGEAFAVQMDGRASPHQTLGAPENRQGLSALLAAVRDSHREAYENTDDLVVGLQLTHSGRFARPNSRKLEPRIVYHHPLLDAKFGIASDDASLVLSDDEVQRLIDAFVAAAGAAHEIGFDFVDVKCCHGYLLHEFLSARTRPGPFGGDLEGRSRVLTTIIGRLRDLYPDLVVGVRMSVFDMPPYEQHDGEGRPMSFTDLLPYQFGFGVDPENPLLPDFEEPLALIRRLKGLGVAMLNVSGGSPYYNPHCQRPAIFPPSDGYAPPEDPLVGVVRQVQAARVCKQAVPDLPMVGSGYTYLQDYVPQVGQALVRDGWIDVIGLGRMALSYPELPHDALTEGKLTRKRICRTFSDCTTAPRNGLISGCFPLDPYYKGLPEAAELKSIKQSK